MTAKDLKNALLQEAVQGKLVPQIASEGNARDLLEEIRKANEGGECLPLSSARKHSSATPSAGTPRNAPISEDEIPFDIPESWCWVRITDIATCELGKTKDAQKNTGKLKDYLCSINIQEDGIDLSKVKQMKFEDDEFERYTVKKNDLLVCEGGDAGRCAIYNREQPMHYQNALHRIRFFNEINPTFYLYIFQLYKANKILTEASKGVTIQHLTGASLKNLWFPLPPLAEQKRIVAAIEKFMPLIEEYGKKETVLNQLNKEIDTLTKKAILQEAVQGKLVPQDSSEGSAKDLLKEIKAQREALIKAGKIKKEKPLPEISEDEIPFDIPENWCWCRAVDICNILDNGRKPVTKNERKKGIYPYYGANGILDYVSDYLFDGVYVLIGEDGSVQTKGGNPVVNWAEGKIWVNNHAHVIQDFDNLGYMRYLFYAFQSINISEFVHGFMPKYSQGDLKKTLIPLPPLSEQKRIVAAIEQLLPLCEKLGK